MKPQLVLRAVFFRSKNFGFYMFAITKLMPFSPKPKRSYSPAMIDKASSRFTAPSGFNDPVVAREIDGLKPEDEGYAEAWAKKKGIPFKKLKKGTLV
ncbi:hypothetical protein WB44_01570 [Synechococcus sp. WH 8020]|uniref:hypothetical protein n=1 Tax=Synechococcus sp. (strain WH8020) TaxID=32052 RepID=UPI0006526A5B|nr:hypothetical protein [Synechococcus sp. WH 8020]AKN60028.1 hypothetical protein WB44_01570 [Synechococcus sp. WH 8020]